MALGWIDVSNHKADIDLSKISNPAPYIGIKVTEGKGWVDKTWRRFADQIRALGKIPVYYHFVSQNNTPEQEADNFINQLKDYIRPGEVACLDWEPNGTNPRPSNVEWARKWLQRVDPALGRRSWIYMNLSTANAHDWRDIAAQNPLWLAHYPGNNTANGYNPVAQRGNLSSQWRNLIAWQFTDRGRIPGYSGYLDLNLYYGPSSTTESVIPKVVTSVIPQLREADPAVNWRDGNGRTWKVCECMRLTLPLVEAEMKKRGLIKYCIDVFQGGYNKGGVALSAGTHDMGGVIDVAQGQTLEQRKVWAMFGVMMFPRTRQWGWTTGDHGHGVWHGCPHQTASADAQVYAGIAGRDGLVSNIRRNFEAPKRTWQEAYLEASRVELVNEPVARRAAPNEVWAKDRLNYHGFNRHAADQFQANLREFQMVYMGKYQHLGDLDAETVQALENPKFVSSLKHATEYFTPMDVRLCRYAQLKLEVACDVAALVPETWNALFTFKWSQAAYLIGFMNWQVLRGLDLQFPMTFEYWKQFAAESGMFDPVE